MWLLIFFGGALYLAYNRVSLRAATIAVAVVLVAYSVFGSGSLPWTIALWTAFAALVLLNIDAIRLRYVTKPFLMVYRRMLPTMSDTELEAARGRHRLVGRRALHGQTRLAEAAVGEGAAAHRRGTGIHRRSLRGAVPDDRRLGHHHRRADLPPQVWDYLKKKASSR